MPQLINTEKYTLPEGQSIPQVSYSELAERGKFLSHHAVGELWVYKGSFYTCKVDNGQERVYWISENMARELQSKVFTF